MRIAFILPQTAATPIGGAKIVYQYADLLSDRGHSVTLFHPEQSVLTQFRNASNTEEYSSVPGRHQGDAYSELTIREVDPHPWYRSRQLVENVVIPRLDEQYIPGTFDITIVNNVHAVSALKTCITARLGMRVYFLQDYECYVLGNDEWRQEALKTLKCGWPILCSSLATRSIAEAAGCKVVHLVMDSVDTEMYRVTRRIEDESRSWIGFPARVELAKRTRDAVEAVGLVRPYLPPGTNVWCFGSEPVEGIPSWISYYRSPTNRELRELYNRSSLFIIPSEHEGFGLPGAEAMACGATLISTLNGGVDSYARHEETALLCPARAPAAIALAIRRLLATPKTRIKLAKTGSSNIARRTIDLAAAEFERALVNELANRTCPT